MYLSMIIENDKDSNNNDILNQIIVKHHYSN